MDMKQAMVERHMVRKYTDKPIPTEIVRRINGRVSDVNAEYRTDIELVRDDGSAFNAAIKLILAKGVRNYFILAAEPLPICASGWERREPISCCSARRWG